MGQTSLQIPEAAALMGLTHGIMDDFDHYVSADTWTTVVSDSGTVVVNDAAGGIVTLTPSDGSVGDNDEAYLKSTKEIFKFASGKPGEFEALIKFVEANTDDANVMVGVMDAVGADSLVDNGAGPKSSYSGAVFFKADGDTVWNAESSNGATQKTTNLTADVSLTKAAVTAGGSAYQRLRIRWIPTADGLMTFEFFVDGKLVAIHESRSYSSATEMQAFAAVKNGDTNLETLLVDYIRCHQVR